MKEKHLKALIKEIAIHALKEGKIQDPSKEDMMAYLKQQYGREEGWHDEAEVAIYWFANFYHGGQWSNLYSALSTSPFNPGPIARGPEKDSMESMMYRDLVHQFAGGEGLDDDEDEVTETEELGNENKKYTVRYAILGREGIEPTEHNSKTEAIKAARDFIQSVVSPGAKKSGEYIEAVKNGYIVRQAGGNTVAAAVIQGATMFQENVQGMDVNKYKALKKAYNQAVKTGQISFEFEGKPMMTEYAKYMLEYLAPKFGGIKEAYMPAPEAIVEYLKPMPGAKPFTLNTSHEGPQKFEVCIGKYPNGKSGIAIYAYRGDFAISVEHFNDIYGSLL